MTHLHEKLSRPKNQERFMRYKISEEAKVFLQEQLERLTVQYEEDLPRFTELSKEVVLEAVQAYNMKDLVELLELLTGNVAPHSTVVIHNLPLDKQSPGCPSNGGDRHMKKQSQVPEAVMMAFGSFAGGAPIGYAFESSYSHPIVHNSCPSNRSSALGSNVTQELHQDMSYVAADLVPDILVLFNLVEGPDPSATTDVLDNRDILQYVPPKDQKILSEDRFTYLKPKWVTAELQPKPKAILSGPKLAPSIATHVLEETIQATDDEAAESLRVLKQAIAKAAKLHVNSFHTVPGDLIIFNNRRVLHRGSTSKRKDSEQKGGPLRLLLRAYFAKNIIKGTIVNKPHD